MSDKKEGAIYQCDAGHWYVQSVGSGPGSWSLPFVGCPVCKLASALARIDELNGAPRKLANLTAALAEQADESPFTREEWDRADKQTAEHIAEIKDLKSRLDKAGSEAQMWRRMLGAESYNLAQAQSRLEACTKVRDGFRALLPDVQTVRTLAVVSDLTDALLDRAVEIPAPISHVGCVLCDGSGWKDIMIGAETKRLPCSGPIPVPLE